MFDRFRRRGQPRDAGPVHANAQAEPTGAPSVLNALRAMMETEWIGLAAAEDASQSDTGGWKKDDAIYRAAYAAAKRIGRYDDLGKSLGAARKEAAEIAARAAGPEALAAQQEVDAVMQGRGRTLLVDPDVGRLAMRYVGFMDAATNAVSVAVLRPYISAHDFAEMWRPYAAVIRFATVHDERQAPAPVAPASPQGADAGRLRFGPNWGQVVWFLDLLSRGETKTWKALIGVHFEGLDSDFEVRQRDARRIASILERAAARGVAAGGLTQQDVPEARRLAEDAAAKLEGEALQRSTQPRDQMELVYGGLAGSVANTVVMLLVVRPYLEAGEFEGLWAPYAETLPLTSWAPGAGQFTL